MGSRVAPRYTRRIGSVPGVVAWTVLTGAELAVYVQAAQRRAHAPPPHRRL